MRRSVCGAAMVVMGLLMVALGLQATDAGAGASCGTALVAIDVQNVYVGTVDQTTIDGQQLLTKLPPILAAARLAGVPVIYVQQLDYRFSAGSPELDVAGAIAPLEGEPRVWKTLQNAFWYTGIDGVLARIGAHRVILCGLSTTGCVNASVLGALRLGFETWVIADAHVGGGLAGGQHYNELWAAAGATVVDSQSIDFADFGCATAAGG